MKTKNTEQEEVMKTNKVIGYIRVSTTDQDTEKNKAAILSFANDKDFGQVHFITEKVSGMKSWKKRKLSYVVETLQAGDVLIVPELSRLGRSLPDILDVLQTLSNKKVKVFSVKENFQLNGDDMQSKMMRTMLGLFAEIEHDLIVQRTIEGLNAARMKGQQLGRPKGPGRSKLDPYKDEIIELLQHAATQRYIAKRYGVTDATVTNWLKKRKLRHIKPKY